MEAGNLSDMTLGPADSSTATPGAPFLVSSATKHAHHCSVKCPGIPIWALTTIVSCAVSGQPRLQHVAHMELVDASGREELTQLMLQIFQASPETWLPPPLMTSRPTRLPVWPACAQPHIASSSIFAALLASLHPATHVPSKNRCCSFARLHDPASRPSPSKMLKHVLLPPHVSHHSTLKAP